MKMRLFGTFRISINEQQRDDAWHFDADCVYLFCFLDRVDILTLLDPIVDDLFRSYQCPQVGFLAPEL